MFHTVLVGEDVRPHDADVLAADRRYARLRRGGGVSRRAGTRRPVASCRREQES